MVNAVTKAYIKGRNEPILFLMNYATMITDPEETESLHVPFQSMKHGIKFDMTPGTLGGTGSMYMNDERFPMQYDGEKLYFSISKPTEKDIELYECYELSSPIPPSIVKPRIGHPRRERKATTWEDIPICEWRTRFANAPEHIVRKTLENTTQFYLNIDCENRTNMRQHYKSRFLGLRLPRQREGAATDTFFPSVKTSKGDTCSQLFVGLDSDRWYVHPLRKESLNGEALKDYTRTVGVPTHIKSDNAQSELGQTWTQYCRDQCISSITTEPDHPWQNPAENRIGTLGRMVRSCIRQFKVPLGKHDWVQKWCVDVHNVLASEKLGWQTPLAISEGHTPDISKFRFHIWEPIWYYDPTVKQPQDNLKKGRWLGFAHTAGDEMTYYIETEKEKGRNTILIRSLIKTRRKHLGTDREYIGNSPDLDSFLLDINKDSHGDLLGEIVTVDDEAAWDTIQKSTDEAQDPPLEPPTSPLTQRMDETSDMHDDEDLLHQFNVEDEEDMEFDAIVDHSLTASGLTFKIKYLGMTEDEVLTVPFRIIKKDFPLETAKYIRQNVLEERRGGKYNAWAQATIKAHSRLIRRLHRHYNIGRTLRARKNRTKAGMSRNQRIAAIVNREKYGIKVPQNVRQALLYDTTNNNTLWSDAIAKEMTSLLKLNVFKFHSSTHKCSKHEGWSFAPMHMIFDIKREDLRYKARLVIGGHVIDSSSHNTYSSTVQDISVRLLQLVALQNQLHIMTGDISNAFCTAPVAEKIYSRAGPEFGDRAGCIVELKRALYGLKTASRSFHEFFAECLMRMGFKPTRADPDLWYRKSDDYEGYDYMATHVDDVIIAAKRPAEYMAQIEHEFNVRNQEDSPSYYLGNSYKRLANGTIHVSSTKYLKEVLKQFSNKYGEVKKESIPMKPKAHPEIDDSPFLDDEGIKQYQHIVGVCQWLVVAGRFDINYTVSSLSRFSIAPRQGHLLLARQLMGYLRKYPKRGYVINPAPLHVPTDYEIVAIKEDFGYQYTYFQEEMDPRFPKPLTKELDINFFVDADHGHDKVTGRSITGLIGLVGSTPIIWSSKRQSCVQLSTFGAEFTALKKAVEDATTIRYHLRSMGVMVEKATPIYVDNMSVVLNASNPGSTLNKKVVALAYHYVREHQANSVIEIRKIESEENYGDPFTKALNSSDFHAYFYELQTN